MNTHSGSWVETAQPTLPIYDDRRMYRCSSLIVYVTLIIYYLLLLQDQKRPDSHMHQHIKQTVAQQACKLLSNQD